MLVPVPVRVGVLPVPAGADVVQVGGWTLGGILLADYDETATLAYRELIVFSALALVDGRPGLVVSHIYVDDAASQAGGREIWGLPKELATFAARDGAVTVHARERLLTARIRVRRRRARLPLASAAIGELHGRAVRAAALGTLSGGLATADLDVPTTAPFAALGLHGANRPALAGDGLDLLFPAPH